jgi:diguanylate cyclase (GGDEF)-like protein
VAGSGPNARIERNKLFPPCEVSAVQPLPNSIDAFKEIERAGGKNIPMHIVAIPSVILRFGRSSPVRCGGFAKRRAGFGRGDSAPALFGTLAGVESLVGFGSFEIQYQKEATIVRIEVMHGMYGLAAKVDRFLNALSRSQIVAAACCSVVLIGVADYVTGYQISVSVFYLVPVMLAAWYAGKRAGIGLAVVSSFIWLTVDIGTAHPYDHFAIPFWNALVRLGFFLVNGILAAALRSSLLREREFARTDVLTGSFSRRAFDERLEQDLDRARRQSGSLTLMFLDLDNLKTLNDTRGHAAGDEALREAARALMSGTRRIDTVARLGGDEFAVVFPGTDQRDAKEVTKKLVGNLRRALTKVGPGVTCSVGVITYEDAPLSIDEAVRGADTLLYDAKRHGKNRVVYGVSVSAHVHGQKAAERARGSKSMMRGM